MSSARKFMEEQVGPITVGMLLRAHRTRLSMTQGEMAAKLGLKVQYISDVENDRKLPSMEKVIEMAETLGESVNQFVRVWTEQTYRGVGLGLKGDFEVVPLKKSPKSPRSAAFIRTGKNFLPQKERLFAAKKATTKTIHHKKATRKRVAGR
jgi:transcriptional regulator with XRE-family HTH domain